MLNLAPQIGTSRNSATGSSKTNRVLRLTRRGRSGFPARSLIEKSVSCESLRFARHTGQPCESLRLARHTGQRPLCSVEDEKVSTKIPFADEKNSHSKKSLNHQNGRLWTTRTTSISPSLQVSAKFIKEKSGEAIVWVGITLVVTPLVFAKKRSILSMPSFAEETSLKRT